MSSTTEKGARAVTDRAGSPRPRLCGFCVTGDHNLCPETIRNGSAAANKTWTCPCSQEGHALGRQPALNREVRRMPASALPPRAPAGVAIAAGTDVPGSAPAVSRRTRPRKAADPFPAGVCSPYQFRKALADRGLVPASFKPQTVYTWVTQAGKGGTFPVRWYAADGSLTTSGADGARPGVTVDEAVAWFTASQAAA